MSGVGHRCGVALGTPLRRRLTVRETCNPASANVWLGWAAKGRRLVVHIELSLSAADAPADRIPSLRVLSVPHPLGAWLESIAAAEDACLVLDSDGIVLGISPPCVALFGVGAAEDLLGRGLLDDVLDVVDFTASRERLSDAHLERLPPLLALSSGALARGLVRVRTSSGVRTLDAIATPLHIKGELAGSLTFFHKV